MPFPTLPPELWREIVSLATYTLTCFDTSPHPDTWNPLSNDFIERYEANFRTKRALAFVSRQIHQIILEFLCDILILEYDPAAGASFKQLGRIAPLIPYLPTTQHVLVESVRKNYFDDAAQSLQQILQQCLNLRGFYLCFPPILELGNPQKWLQDVSVQTQIALSICPKLQFLDIRGEIWENVYEIFMNRVSLTLRSHRMAIWRRNFEAFGDAMIDHHPTESLLPQLNSFHLSIWNNTILSFTKFNMSALAYLSIGIPSPRNILTQILESAGDSILSLRLGERCNVDNDVLSIALRAPRLQFLAYPFEPSSVAWLNDQMCHDTLQNISVEYPSRRSPIGTADEIFRCHFHPVSKRRFPMLRTVTVAPMVGPHKVLRVYDLEDGKRLEDADTVRPMKLYFCGPHR